MGLNILEFFNLLSSSQKEFIAKLNANISNNINDLFLRLCSIFYYYSLKDNSEDLLLDLDYLGLDLRTKKMILAILKFKCYNVLDTESLLKLFKGIKDKDLFYKIVSFKSIEFMTTDKNAYNRFEECLTLLGL